MDDASLAKLTVSDTKGESFSDDVSDVVVPGKASVNSSQTMYCVKIPHRNSNKTDYLSAARKHYQSKHYV